MNIRWLSCWLTLAAMTTGGHGDVATAQQVGNTAERPTAATAAYRAALPPEQRRAFFGELHLHTNLSFDAWVGGTKVTPEDAFRFGRGESVTIPAFQVQKGQGLAVTDGVAVRRARPLDFMAVTDHAEFLGAMAQLDEPGNSFAATATGQAYLRDPGAAATARYSGRVQNRVPQLPAEITDPAVALRAWESVKAAANANYRPGQFTTFIAFEWSAAPSGRNLHRNVIFNADRAPAPFSSEDSPRPEDLWSYLERSRRDGIDVIAIPHNANASDGLMYDWNDSDGRPIDQAYAQRRAMNEPLSEIVQIKGQSDTVPLLSSNDEFANFEVFDHQLGRISAKSRPAGSYVRDAYGRGLVIGARVGANPYAFGIVAGSDIHNGLSISDESGFAGGEAGIDPASMSPTGLAARQALGLVAFSRPGREAAATGSDDERLSLLERGSGGLTGVWAEENTRNSIFAALKRKETFGTSGTRIRVRAFAGWSLDQRLMADPGWVSKAYARGVPMGSDLPARPPGARSPGFLIHALKDPDGVNLDRVQVVKLWLDGAGYKEKIHDVALSDRRRVDPRTGQAPALVSTVDLKTGKVNGGTGASSFTTFWRDPDFDASRAAVYYVRVLEVPSPRWSTLLAIRAGEALPDLRSATIQERAWASPFWYTPPR